MGCVCLLCCALLMGCLPGEDRGEDRGKELGDTQGEAQPNILLIVADDLGYSDLGAFGSEINTPNLDKLAASGLMLTNFHSHATCSPTRSMLLTGTDNHIAGMGTMYGSESPEQRGQPGYETHLNFRVVTIASLLRDAGYHTSMVGKWHLGRADKLLPDKRGFDDSYALLEGGADHFSQLGLTPSHLASYRENGKAVDLPDGFYSSEFYTDKLIGYIDQHRDDSQPFFAYAAYTAPHWPLQAPDEYIKRYEGVYDVGYDIIRQRRLARMQRLGIVDKDIVPATQNPVWPDWRSLSSEQQQHEARRMQVYAAMVEALDHHIGRLIDHLDSIGELNNTLIVFMSDNGAEGNSPTSIPGVGPWIADNFENGLDDIGKEGSFAWYGPGWAHVSNTPFRLYKSFPTRGGIVVPAFFVQPGKIKPGVQSAQFASVLDITPTLLDLANITHPGNHYKGRSVHPLQGDSMLPFLQGEAKRVHPSDYVMGWEIFNRRALQQGDWKLLWINQPWGEGEGDGHWTLYNLATDPAEQQDLADRHPEKVAELLLLWHDYVRKNGVITIDKLDLSYTNSTDYYNPESRK